MKTFFVGLTQTKLVQGYLGFNWIQKAAPVLWLGIVWALFSPYIVG